jgi:hypothetical protein
MIRGYASGVIYVENARGVVYIVRARIGVIQDPTIDMLEVLVD